MNQLGTEKVIEGYCLSKQYPLDRGLAQGIAQGITIENGGLRLGNEDLFSTAILEIFTFSNIEIPNPDHFARCEARSPFVAGTIPIFGVFYGSRFVDGYHRVKWAIESGLPTGHFIILY